MRQKPKFCRARADIDTMYPDEFASGTSLYAYCDREPGHRGEHRASFKRVRTDSLDRIIGNVRIDVSWGEKRRSVA